MTRIELEKVADVFFPDRRALHLVDVSEIVAKLTQKHDWKKVENESDAVKIEREVSVVVTTIDWTKRSQQLDTTPLE